MFNKRDATGNTERMSVTCPECGKLLQVITQEYLEADTWLLRTRYVARWHAPPTFLCGCSTLLHLELVETRGGDRDLVVTRTEKAEPQIAK